MKRFPYTFCSAPGCTEMVVPALHLCALHAIALHDASDAFFPEAESILYGPAACQDLTAPHSPVPGDAGNPPESQS